MSKYMKMVNGEPVAMSDAETAERQAEEAAWEAGAAERALQAVRAKRAPLLAASDWTQGADAPLSVESKAGWALYRQALRDITRQADPNAVVWPLVSST